MFNRPDQQYQGGINFPSKISYKQTVNKFQNSIRKAQRQKIMKRYRQQYRTATQPNYKLLSSINLQQHLSQFVNFNSYIYQHNSEKYTTIIQNMFIYARSSQADHMFSLFNQKQLRKLIQLTNEININDRMIFDTRNYIRILWILASYIAYAQIVQLEVLQMLEQMYSVIIKTKDLYIPNREITYKTFTSSQTRNILQILYFCFAIILKDKNVLIYQLQSQNFNQAEQQQLTKIPSLLTKFLNQIKQICCYSMYYKIDKQSFAIKILEDILTIFTQILKMKQFQEIATSMQEIFTNLIQAIINLMNQFYQHSVQYQMESFTQILILYYINYLKKDNLKLIHNHITKIHIIYIVFERQVDLLMKVHNQLKFCHSRLQIQGQILRTEESLKEEKDKSQKKVIKWLELIEVFYSIDIPDNENEDFYYQHFDKWADNYIIPKFNQLLDIKQSFSHKLIEFSLRITSNMIYEEPYLKQIINNNQIMSSILYYISSETQGIWKIKKAALSCIHSLMRNAIQQNSNNKLRNKVLKIFEQAGLIQILARNIGQYADITVNKELLQSLYLYLQSENYINHENREQNLLWIQFSSYKGVTKLLNYLEHNENDEIKSLMLTILNQYGQK